MGMQAPPPSQAPTAPSQAPEQHDCGCPSDGGSNASDITHASIISADLDAGTSGIKLATDVLGSDFIDASVGLGAVHGVVDTVLGLTDTGTGLLDDVNVGGLLDGLLCDIV